MPLTDRTGVEVESVSKNWPLELTFISLPLESLTVAIPLGPVGTFLVSPDRELMVVLRNDTESVYPEPSSAVAVPDTEPAGCGVQGTESRVSKENG